MTDVNTSLDHIRALYRTETLPTEKRGCNVKNHTKVSCCTGRT